MAGKEVKFGVKIGAKVEGQESVESLTARLDDMAKVLDGELRQVAQAAAAELRTLGQQQQAITTFQQLESSAKEAGIALKRADAEVAAFAKQITQAGPPTAQEAQHLQKLEAAAEGARTSLQGQKLALAGAVSELQRHGIAAGQTAAAQQRLSAEIEEVRNTAALLGPTFQGNARAATSAGEAMQRSHRAVGEGVQSISTQLERVQGAYLALQGGGALGSMIKDAVQTADAFKTLSARIKLVTGDNEAFETALAGVQRVAMSTRSDLEATGTLFTKLATAGKELGLSQAQALALTETINQAIQITGGSADSSKAAITQLTQGLQSGTLRGDEFNSVMEQAPRLAQALAAGLGVGTGELRAMAEQGRLTSEAVVTALRGQTDAIATEFGKIPPTVSGALQNLSTAWTGFVGQLDQSSGATEKLAGGLKFLADNLDTIAGTAVTLGQGALALGLLRITQSFLSWATNAKSAAAATAQAAVDTARATQATDANTKATDANTTAKARNAGATKAMAVASTELASGSKAVGGALDAANAAKDGATKKAGLLATAWGGVARAGSGLLGLIGGPIGLVALTAAYAKDIGELTAKLVLKAKGLKNLEEIEAERLEQQRKANEEAEREKAARDAQIAADKAAAAAKFGLGKAAQGLVTEFEELRKKGTSVDDAINQIGKKFDLSTQPGIRDAASVLDKLQADGTLSATQFEQAWTDALKGVDLAEFESRAQLAFEGSERGAEQLGQALDGLLRETIRRTGLDFDLISGGMSKASRQSLGEVDLIIAGLDRLKAQGVDTEAVLQASLTKAINTADSQKAIDELRNRIESMRKVLGDKVTDGLLEQAAKQSGELKKKLDEAIPGINSTAEAMRVLGVTSQESLKKTADEAQRAYEFMRSEGKATARELTDAFKAYAERAIAGNGGVATEALKVEAAMRGLVIETDNAGRAMVKSMAEGGKAAQAMDSALKGIGNTLRDNIKAQEDEIAAMERANDLRERAAELERKRLNIDKDGFTVGKDGNRLAVGVQTRRSVFEEAKRQGVSEQEALEIAKRFIDDAGQEVNFQNAGSLSMAVQQAIDRAVLQRAGGATGGGDGGGSNGGGTPVIINLPSGYSQKLNVVSPADANALQQLLTKLLEDKARAGP